MCTTAGSDFVSFRVVRGIMGKVQMGTGAVGGQYEPKSAQSIQTEKEKQLTTSNQHLVDDTCSLLVIN